MADSLLTSVQAAETDAGSFPRRADSPAELLARFTLKCRVRAVIQANRMINRGVPAKLFRSLLTVYLAARSLPYMGDKFTCPACGQKFRKLIHWRTHRICPSCHSYERHRLLWLYLKARTNLFSDQVKVLHIGPEYAFKKLLESMPNVDYVGIDRHSSLASARMDLSSLAFADDTFDAIICTHVMEHVEDDRKAMRELLRVLKAGTGWAIIHSPVEPSMNVTLEAPDSASPEDRQRLFGHYDHQRVYGLDYYNRLEKAGFRVEVVDYVSELRPDDVAQYALRKNNGNLPDRICFTFKP